MSEVEMHETIHAVAAEMDTIFTWDYERSRPALDQALREGQDLAVERDDRSRLVDRRRPREGRRRARRRDGRRGSNRWPRPNSPARALRREGVARGLRADAELAALAVPPRRAGRAAVHRPHRGDRAVDRREVLRVDAGGGRSSPRRGLRQVPLREDADPVQDQRQPRAPARRHPLRLAAGTSPTSACRSWSKASRSRRSG